MIEFEKPNIECVETDDKRNYAKFICEPLERGYGMTIGNSLRRILLSSLPGCAITGVKIDSARERKAKPQKKASRAITKTPDLGLVSMKIILIK